MPQEKQSPKPFDPLTPAEVELLEMIRKLSKAELALVLAALKK